MPRAVMFVIVLVAAGAGGAAPAHRIADLAPGVQKPASAISNLTSLGSRAYFCVDHARVVADHEVPDGRLWVTDGTPGGTRLVRDISPGSDGMCPAQFIGNADNAWFVTGDGDRSVLWQTAGTAASTAEIEHVWSFESASDRVDAGLFTVWAGPGRMLFMEQDIDSDHSRPAQYECGRLMMRDTAGNPGGFEDDVVPWSWLPFGTSLLYRRCHPHQIVRWSPASETAEVLGVASGDPVGMALLGTMAILGDGIPQEQWAYGDTHHEALVLWRSDGTSAGTQPFITIPSPGWILGSGPAGVFAATSDANGESLWVTDGTAANTRNLPLPVSTGDAWSVWTGLPTLTLFIARHPDGSETLWKIDASGTIRDPIELPAPAEGHMIVVPWNGAAGIVRGSAVAVLRPGARILQLLTALDGIGTSASALDGGALLVATEDGRLRAIDDNGTQRLLSASPPLAIGSLPDPRPSKYPEPRRFDTLSGRSVLDARRSDGTVALVSTDGSDVTTLATGSPEARTNRPIPVPHVVGVTTRSAWFRLEDAGVPYLWRTNAAATQAERFPSTRFDAAAVGEIAGVEYVAGGELHESDDVYRIETGGLDALNIRSTVTQWSSHDVAFEPSGHRFVLDGRLYDLASGTPRDIGSSASFWHARFIGPPGFPLYAAFEEPWELDVSVGAFSGASSRIDSFVAEDMFWFRLFVTSFRGSLWYLRGNEQHRIALARTDGTRAGTFAFKELGSSTCVGGRCRRAAIGLTSTEDFLLFVNDEPGAGSELWRTDGTLEGTALVRDIFPGPEGSQPGSLTALGPHGPILFTACDPEHGCEPWISWGTAKTTELLADLVPGPGSSWPSQYTVHADRVDFSAEDDEHGREPWTLERALISTDVFDIACPNDVHVTSATGDSMRLQLPQAMPVGALAGAPVSYVPSLTSGFPVGTTRVTATAFGFGGRTATCSWAVVVEDGHQTEAPPDPPAPDGGSEAVKTITVPEGCGCSALPSSGVLLVVFASALRRARRKSS